MTWRHQVAGKDREGWGESEEWKLPGSYAGRAGGTSGTFLLLQLRLQPRELLAQRRILRLDASGHGVHAEGTAWLGEDRACTPRTPTCIPRVSHLYPMRPRLRPIAMQRDGLHPTTPPRNRDTPAITAPRSLATCVPES